MQTTDRIMVYKLRHEKLISEMKSGNPQHKNNAARDVNDAVY
jgi:hypothetical protein